MRAAKLAAKGRARIAKVAKVARRTERRKAHVLPESDAVRALFEGRDLGDDLAAYAQHAVSQHGEDGIVYEILRRAGMPNKTCVEIGCGSNGGNAGVLPTVGYRALMVDGSADLTQIAANLFKEHDVAVVNEWITPESVNDLLTAHGFVGEIDYFGVDLDGVDYWILEGLTVAQPILIVAEYNQLWGGEVSAAIQYQPDFSRKARTGEGGRAWPAGYYGVSIAGLVTFGRRRGYRLVASHEGNAFLLKNGVCPEFPEITPQSGWQVKTKGRTPRLTQQICDQGPLQYFAERGAPLFEIR